MTEEALTLEEAVEKLSGLFEDGFQWKDLWDAVPMAMELVEGFTGLDGAAKKDRVLKIIDKMLDTIDLPGPDWVAKPIIMWFVPGAIDKFVEVAKGKFSF